MTLEDAKSYMGNQAKLIHDENKAVAYVDGSYSDEIKMFSYGAVIFYNGETKEFSKAFSNPELIDMRNVAGEIKGSEFVMQYCIDNNIKSIDIYYDYAGIEKWCTKEWKTNKPGTMNYALFYDSIKDRLNVNFIKVKGHSDNEKNNRCDKLARLEISKL
jgi:ribonuclease HI